MLDGARRNQERLTIHGHLKSDLSYKKMNVRIKNVNQMGIVSPLERKLGILTPLLDNDRKDNVLECFEVNNMLS